MTQPSWTPYREPMRGTLMRTVAIAIVAGTVLMLATKGRVTWPAAVLVMLWPALGGHYVELWFLNWLRPRLSAERRVQIAARLVTWFAGGMVLAVLMALTARAVLGGRGAGRLMPWWVAGLGFTAIELVAHLGLRMRSRPSVYDGLG